jgi:hypothetical protein
MDVEIRIGQVEINGGEHAELPLKGVTCIVGGNNVGKSQFLRDVISHLNADEGRPVVLSSIDLHRTSFTLEDLKAWLEATCVLEPTGAEVKYSPMLGGAVLTLQHFQIFLFTGQFQVSLARPFFCWYADAGSRVQLGSGSLGPSPGMGPNTSPLAAIFKDGEVS